MNKKKIPVSHPGVILYEEFMQPMKITQYRLAKDICVPPRRINEIIHKQKAITANTVLRLAKYFGNSPEFWMRLQALYDLKIEKEKMMECLAHDISARAHL